jgi:hypothetical protein
VRQTPIRGAGPPGASGPVRARRRLRAVLRSPAIFTAFRAAVGIPLTGAAFRAAAPAVPPHRRAR